MKRKKNFRKKGFGFDSSVDYRAIHLKEQKQKQKMVFLLEKLLTTWGSMFMLLGNFFLTIVIIALLPGAFIRGAEDPFIILLGVCFFNLVVFSVMTYKNIEKCDWKYFQFKESKE